MIDILEKAIIRLEAISGKQRGEGARAKDILCYCAIAAVLGALYFFAQGTKFFAPLAAGVVGIAAAGALLPNTKLLVYLAVVSLPFMTTDVIMLATGKFAGAGAQPVYVFTAGALCSLLFNYLVSGRPARAPRSGAHFAVLLFFGVSAVSIIPVLLSGPPGLGAENYFKYLNMTALNFVAMGFYFCLVLTIRDRPALLRVFFLLILVTDFVALYGVFRQVAIFVPALNEFDLLSKFINNNKSMYTHEGALEVIGGGFSRLRSTAYEAGGFGDYLMTALPALVCLLMNKKAFKGRGRVFYGVSAAVVFAVFLATLARAAFAGFAVSLAVIALATAFKRAGAARALRLAVFFALIVGGIFLAASIFMGGKQGRDSIVSVATGRFSSGYIGTDKSVMSRLSAVRQAEGNFEKSPLWGRGFAIAGFYSYDKAELTDLWMMEQTLLTTTVGEAGIVGAVAFIVFFFFFVFEGARAVKASAGDPVLSALALGFFASFIGQVATRALSLNFQFCHFWLPVAMVVLIRAIASGRRAGADADEARGPVL